MGSTYDPNKRLVFTDTETTGLHREFREVWEIGLVVRDPGKPDREYEWQIRPEMLAPEEVGLRIGGYYQRNRLAREGFQAGTATRIKHPDYDDGQEVPYPRGTGDRKGVDAFPAFQLAAELAVLLDGAQLVGMCTWFDEHSLWRFLLGHKHALTCDYHLVDVESMCAGFAHAAARWAPHQWLSANPARPAALERVKNGPGWTSADLGDIVGVTAPADRHRALVDARWGRDVFDVITNFQHPPHLNQ